MADALGIMVATIALLTITTTATMVCAMVSSVATSATATEATPTAPHSLAQHVARPSWAHLATMVHQWVLVLTPRLDHVATATAPRLVHVATTTAPRLDHVEMVTSRTTATDSDAAKAALATPLLAPTPHCPQPALVADVMVA